MLTRPLSAMFCVKVTLSLSLSHHLFLFIIYVPRSHLKKTGGFTQNLYVYDSVVQSC